MRILFGLESVSPPLERSVLTIGNFDGVHRAHQRLISRTAELARAAQSPAVVLTFEPHPLSVVAPDRVPPRLCSLEDKLRHIEECGAELTVVARSEPALMKQEAAVFVSRVIRDLFHPVHIVEGPSFGFGRGRRGTPEVLRELARGFGCEVHIVEPIQLELEDLGTRLISSSLIRELVGQGRVELAAAALGRNYSLTGTVVMGEGRGRLLGFPTANLKIDDQLIPGDGVYRGTAKIDSGAESRPSPCAISIGCTPTFGGRTRQVEVHLLDFVGDLYGRRVRVEFTGFLRAQRRFDSAQALTEQLQDDIRIVRGQIVEAPGTKAFP